MASSSEVQENQAMDLDFPNRLRQWQTKVEATTREERTSSGEWFFLAVALPFCDQVRWSYVYSSLPLHFATKEWPLWGLAVVLGCAYAPRFAVSKLISRKGEWVCVPLTFVATLAALAAALRPDDLLCVGLAVVASSASIATQAHRGLLLRTGAKDDDDAKSRSLKVFSVADVVGYASGGVLGGLLFDWRGFQACAVFSFAVLSFELLVEVSLACVGVLSFRRDDANHQASKKSVGSAVAEKKQQASLEYSVAFGAAGINVFAYVVEWSLFALYFREVHGSSALVAGAAQSLGDLLAAAGLAATTVTTLGTRRPSLTALPNRSWTEPPLDVGLFLLIQAMLFVAVASRSYACAVAGQILLGAAFVAIERSLHETLAACAACDYRSLVSRQYLLFCLVASVAGAAAVLAYDHTSRQLPFRLAAAALASYALFYEAYFYLLRNNDEEDEEQRRRPLLWCCCRAGDDDDEAEDEAEDDDADDDVEVVVVDDGTTAVAAAAVLVVEGGEEDNQEA